MDPKYVYVGVAGAILLVLVFAFWPKPSALSGPAGATLNFMGVPVSLNPVNGEDVPCIGAPEGYARVFYEHDSDEYGEYTTVGYAREGDHLDEVLSWLESQVSTCGYEKASDTSVSVSGIVGRSISFEKADGSEALSVDVGVVAGADGKRYTIMRIGHDVYYESGRRER